MTSVRTVPAGILSGPQAAAHGQVISLRSLFSFNMVRGGQGRGLHPPIPTRLSQAKTPEGSLVAFSSPGESP